jgi:hypothetical protein
MLAKFILAEMAVQKLHEFCEAEKSKIFALRKIIVQGKTQKNLTG